MCHNLQKMLDHKNIKKYLNLQNFYKNQMPKSSKGVTKIKNFKTKIFKITNVLKNIKYQKVSNKNCQNLQKVLQKSKISKTYFLNSLNLKYFF